MNKTLLPAVAVAIVVVILLILPFFINVDRFRPAIEKRLSDALGRQVQIGSLRFSWFAGGIAARDLQIAEDPSYGTEPFLTAKALDISVELGPLLFHRTLHIKALTVRDPEVRLQELNGKWNFASLGPSQTAAEPEPASSAMPSLSLRKLAITGGTLVVGMPGSAQTYSDVSLSASGFAPGAAFPFKLSVTTPGNGKLILDGTAGPMRSDLSIVPFDAKFQLDGLDLASSGYFGQGSGVGGKAEVKASLRSDGTSAHVDGTATARELRLVQAGHAMRPPVSFAFSADYDLRAESGRLTRGDLQIGKSTLGLTGTLDARSSPLVLEMTAATPAFSVPEIQELLPALGLALPGGSSLQSGTLALDLKIDGPVDRLVTAGPVRLSEVTVGGFDLGAKLKTVAALAGVNTGRDTRIQSLVCKLHIAPEGARVEDLNAVITGLGALTGSGSVAANEALDFHLTANLNKGGGVLGGLLQQAGVGQLSTVPFRISGTTSDPHFMPDVVAILETKQPAAQQQGQTPIGGLLNQLFRKKK
jgi:AsmA protein